VRRDVQRQVGDLVRVQRDPLELHQLAHRLLDVRRQVGRRADIDLRGVRSVTSPALISRKLTSMPLSLDCARFGRLTAPNLAQSGQSE
jgi:hypothetical protein